MGIKVLDGDTDLYHEDYDLPGRIPRLYSHHRIVPVPVKGIKPRAMWDIIWHINASFATRGSI